MKGTRIDLGGETRTLRFDFNALADIEEEAQASFSRLIDQGLISMRTLRLLVWGGLKWQDSKLTLVKAGEWIQGYFDGGSTMEALWILVSHALDQSGVIKSKPSEEPAEEAPGEEMGNAQTEAATKT